jgi:hypothetical protein
MPATSLIKKLNIKPNHRLLILNAPQEYLAHLIDLPEGTQLVTSTDGSPYDFVQAFCYNKADIDSLAPQAIQALKADGLLWFCYPKGTGKIKTDINRDKGWDTVLKAGYGGVTQIAIDDTWSCLRFRVEDQIKRRGSIR